MALTLDPVSLISPELSGSTLSVDLESLPLVVDAPAEALALDPPGDREAVRAQQADAHGGNLGPRRREDGREGEQWPPTVHGRA